MEIRSEPIYDQATIDRIAARYDHEIIQLASVGFQALCIVRETLPPYSLFTMAALYINALSYREPIEVQHPFRLVTFVPLLVCHETGCIALIFGKGLKYYTIFLDGTTLISCNFTDGATVIKPEVGFYKYSDHVDFEQAHHLHQVRVLKLLREDKLLDHTLNFESYDHMSNSELRYAFGENPG
jgi:hypothetical protein